MVGFLCRTNTGTFIPARKPELEVVPSWEAVLLAPDTPLKREVVQIAEGLMAAPMAMLQLASDACVLAVQRFQFYMNEVLRKRPAPADAEKPPRRDPDMVSFAQGQRAVTQSMKLREDMNRLREQCYFNARQVVFLRTHKRVGPRFWPTEAQDAGIAPDPSQDGLELLPTQSPARRAGVQGTLTQEPPTQTGPRSAPSTSSGPRSEGAVEGDPDDITLTPEQIDARLAETEELLADTADPTGARSAPSTSSGPRSEDFLEADPKGSGTVSAQTAAPELSQTPNDDMASVPLTKRYIKAAQDHMLRHGVPKRRHVELVRKARKNGWKVKRFYEEVQTLIECTGKPVESAA